MDRKEYYQCSPGTNCKTDSHPTELKDVGTSLSSNPTSPKLLKAVKERTAYDQYWLKFYNSRSSNYETNLMSLQFS